MMRICYDQGYNDITAVVVVFPHLCLWRRSLCSNLGGIGPEKHYRATLNYCLWMLPYV